MTDSKPSPDRRARRRGLRYAGLGFVVAAAALIEARRWRPKRYARDTTSPADAELAAARDLQLSMLPRRETIAALDPRVEIDALLEPARSVGGDFFDVLRLSRNTIGFVIGDVSGKGISAALLMAVSKALTRSAMLREDGDLGSAAQMLNRELAVDGDPMMGVSMLIGTVDLSNGSVTICNAGHENPLLIGPDGSVCALEMEGGPPFCTVDTYPYPAERMRLEPGEMLVLVSDGATEAQDADGVLFGRLQLVDAVQGCTTATAAAERVLAAVREFENGSDPSDDLAILTLRYIGERAGGDDGPR